MDEEFKALIPPLTDEERCNYEYMRLPAAWLVTDPSYQRAIDERAVERIVENFDPRLVNVVKVSHRDSKFYVWLEAALQM